MQKRTITLEEYLNREQPYSLRIGTKDGFGGFVYIGDYKTNLIWRIDRDTRAFLRDKIKAATENLTAFNGIDVLENRIRDYKNWKPFGQRIITDIAWSTVDDACIITVEGSESMVEYEPEIDTVIRFDSCLDVLMFEMYIPVVKELKIAYQQMRDENLPDDKRKRAVLKAAECERVLLDDKYGYLQGEAMGLIDSIKKQVKEAARENKRLDV